LSRIYQPRPKFGRRKAELDRMLTVNTGNPARERLTLIRLFEELRALGCMRAAMTLFAAMPGPGAGNTPARWRTPIVPLSFAPGAAYQFAWSHEIVVLSGTWAL